MGNPLTTKAAQSLAYLEGVTYMVYQSADAALIYLEFARYVNNNWHYLGYVEQDNNRAVTNKGPGLVAYKDLLHLVYQQGEGSTSVCWATYNHKGGKNWTLNGPIVADNKLTLECSFSPSLELGLDANQTPVIILTYKSIDSAGSISWATCDGQTWIDKGVITVDS